MNQFIHRKVAKSAKTEGHNSQPLRPLCPCCAGSKLGNCLLRRDLPITPSCLTPRTPPLSSAISYLLSVLRFARHRDERDWQYCLLLDFRPMLAQQVKLLIAQGADRDDHSAIVFQLIDKRLGDMVGAQVTIMESNGACSGQPL